MDHIKFKHYERTNRQTYNIDLFQTAADVITVTIKNSCFPEYLAPTYYYDIPVKKASGFCWKCNKNSISCDTGNAADIIKLFKDFSIAYACATVRVICFENEKNRKKIFG